MTTLQIQKFSIARVIKRPQLQHIDPDFAQYVAYLRLEPNGNLFWTIHPELASRWDQLNAEAALRLQTVHGHKDCYLVEATKEDA